MSPVGRARKNGRRRVSVFPFAAQPRVPEPATFEVPPPAGSAIPRQPLPGTGAAARPSPGSDVPRARGWRWAGKVGSRARSGCAGRPRLPNSADHGRSTRKEKRTHVLCRARACRPPPNVRQDRPRSRVPRARTPRCAPRVRRPSILRYPQFSHPRLLSTTPTFLGAKKFHRRWEPLRWKAKRRGDQLLFRVFLNVKTMTPAKQNPQSRLLRRTRPERIGLEVGSNWNPAASRRFAFRSVPERSKPRHASMELFRRMPRMIRVRRDWR